MKDKNKDAQSTGLAQPIVDPTIEGVKHLDASGATIPPGDKPETDESIDLADTGSNADSTTTASDVEITQKVNIPSNEATTDDLSSAGLHNKSAKVLGIGVAAVIAAALIIGYFVTRARPEDAVNVASKPPISAPTSPAQPGVEIIVPLPTGVDATDCRPDQVIVDHANHALVFPASCSKIVFAKPAK